MMLTEHCLTVCLKTTLSPSNSLWEQELLPLVATAKARGKGQIQNMCNHMSNLIGAVVGGGEPDIFGDSPKRCQDKTLGSRMSEERTRCVLDPTLC